MAKIKVLFLDLNVAYVNPTRGLLPQVLQQGFDLTLFGPGYASQNALEKGLEAFIEEKGPFDFVFATEHIVFSRSNFTDPATYRLTNHAKRFPRTHFRFAHTLRDAFERLSLPKVITLLESDYYNQREEYIELLEKIGDYYVCWGGEFLDRKEDVAPESAPDSGANRAIYEQWNDHFFDFVTRKADRVLSTPHFVDASEIGGKPLDRRPSPWSVLGADYNARVEVKALLANGGIKRAAEWLPYIFVLADKAGLNLYGRYATIGLVNYLFSNALRRSRYSYTCGSFLRYPIRKYFEIPANGCVLVAEPCKGFDALGFKHQSNAVACESQDVLDAHEWLEADPGRAQAIANAGKALIASTHSVDARAKQLQQSLALVRDGRFRGSYWSDGELRFYDANA